ncbi:beta-N-acetylhexosaminidase [Humitalea rosea]|uniref:beta-N-acetylhexosaminidase n=1 Tax=Humitalea rosea TaxID=990373 RepID=A0A2W7IPI9_9PROT|nr:beta-N-acetylhexosaminidase [Humitalea rosea]PZW49162.1 beta-N-acetylhexosaminidase [Humitalea rosea]
MPHTPRAAVVGLAGPRLTAEEVALLKRMPPAGVILFRRNVESPAQLRALTDSVRDVLGAMAPILVDQEGGRVARLRAPFWPEFPPAASFEGRPDAAAHACAGAMGAIAVAAGIDTICAPVLDLRLPGAHSVIGDRAFSADPAEVARLGLAWARGLLDAGCVPVMKHIPGHGRATADSHLDLPVVAVAAEVLAADLAPFQALAGVIPWAMTAHIVYPAWDDVHCATLSPRIIEEIIRGYVGFDGVLVSDDLTMKALAGDSLDLAEAALAAGCDLVLHCSGVFAETAALLAGCPAMTARAQERMARARGMAGQMAGQMAGHTA